MAEETLSVSLGGRSWELPHLPFRIIKNLQPRVMRLSNEVIGDDGGLTVALRLGEDKLDELAAAIHTAIAFADNALTLEAFLELPFALSDLLTALPSVMRACGLQIVKPSAAEGGEEKK